MLAALLPLPSGAVNPSSAAPGNAFGHCKDNGNGHPHQQPAGCSTQTLRFAYEYDERGLVAQRDVMSDETTTRTTYTHDALGRLTRSVTSGAATLYVWDAASNLVGEAGTDDPETVKPGDEYAIARTVNDVNQVVSLVKTPAGTPGGKVETTEFSYDGRGNRTGSVTTTQTGRKTHTVASSVFVYDAADQLTSMTGPGGTASWVRDGVGRALSVTEDGATSDRLYDGFTVVADGDTQLNVGPDGLVLGETTSTVTTRGKSTSTSVTSVEVLTDVLGSAVATASDGVISADLHVFGDFGDELTSPKVDTVTGFTGKVSTAGLVEFASRTYDPMSRVWLQDDRFRGTTTRAASLNRYAYVEGAPQSFVDVLGFYRARAAIQAQALAALNAAFQSALAELNQVVSVQARLVGDWSVAQMMASYNMFHASDDPVVRAAMDQIAREAFYGVTQHKYQGKVQVVLAQQAQRREAQRETDRRKRLAMIQVQYASEQQQIAGERNKLWMYDAVDVVKDAAPDMVTMLRNEAIGAGKFVAGLTPVPHVVHSVQCIAGGWSGMSECAQQARDETKALWHTAEHVVEQVGQRDALMVGVFTGDASVGQWWDAAYQIPRDLTFGPTLDACKAGQVDKCGQGIGEGEAATALLFIPGAEFAAGPEIAVDVARTAELAAANAGRAETEATALARAAAAEADAAAAATDAQVLADAQRAAQAARAEEAVDSAAATSGVRAAGTNSVEILQEPAALEGLTPSQIDDLAVNAGYEVLPGKANASNPATRYYVPGTNRSVGFRVLPGGVAGQTGVKAGPYLKYFGGPTAGLRIPLSAS